MPEAREVPSNTIVFIEQYPSLPLRYRGNGKFSIDPEAHGITFTIDSPDEPGCEVPVEVDPYTGWLIYDPELSWLRARWDKKAYHDTVYDGYCVADDEGGLRILRFYRDVVEHFDLDFKVVIEIHVSCEYYYVATHKENASRILFLPEPCGLDYEAYIAEVMESVESMRLDLTPAEK